MIKFIIKRLIALIPVLVGVSLLVYFILDLAPGDPAKTILGEQARPEDIAALREEMGLDDPSGLHGTQIQHLSDVIQSNIFVEAGTDDNIDLVQAAQIALGAE